MPENTQKTYCFTYRAITVVKHYPFLMLKSTKTHIFHDSKTKICICLRLPGNLPKTPGHFTCLLCYILSNEWKYFIVSIVVLLRALIDILRQHYFYRSETTSRHRKISLGLPHKGICFCHQSSSNIDTAVLRHSLCNSVYFSSYK